jgi:hypothetical protein
MYNRPLQHSVMHSNAGVALVTNNEKLVCFLTSLLTIPLACQRCLHALLFAGLQIVGVTLDFLDDVLLLNLPLKSAQRVFERLAFLYANLCQCNTPPNLPSGSPMIPEICLARDLRALAISIIAVQTLPDCPKSIHLHPNTMDLRQN